MPSPTEVLARPVSGLLDISLNGDGGGKNVDGNDVGKLPIGPSLGTRGLVQSLAFARN